jgi:tetratricopeptide (TPR) repeat protein
METLYHTRYWILASVKTEYLGKTLPSASDNLFRTLDLDLEVLRRHRVEEYCNRHAVYLPCDIAHLGFHRKVLGYCKHVVSAVTKLVIREFGQWDELSRVFHLSLELLRLYPRMAIVLERVYQYLLDLCRYAIEPTHPLTLLITNLLSLKHIEREQVMLCAWRLIINSTYGVTGPHFVLYVSVWGYTKLETDDYGLDITYDAIHKTLISSFGEDEQPAFYMGEALLLDSLRRFQDAESAAHQTLQLQLRTGSSCSETEFFIHSACHRVLASCREAMGDIPSAVDHLEYALELKLRDRVTAPDPDRIIDVTERLVRHYIKLGNNQAAKKAQTRLALWKAKRPPPEFPLLFECEDADCILPVTWNDAS